MPTLNRTATVKVGFGAVAMVLFCAAIAPRAQAGQKDSPPSQPAQNPVTAFHEEAIAEVRQGSTLKDALVGNLHVAWVEERDGKRTVMLDGKQRGGIYEDVKELTFSRDETRFAFFGKRASAWFFVLDGAESSKSYTKFTSPAFQPMGSSYAYCACQEKKCRLVVLGEETGGEYEDVSYPAYSLDGKRIVFLGKRAKKWVAVSDGKETDLQLDDFASWGMNRDGSRSYVAGRVKGKWLYAVDGAQGPGFDVVSPIAFSSDGKHFAYAGTVSKGGLTKQKTIGTMVKDGQSILTYEGRGMGGGLLSTNVQWLAGGVRDFAADFDGLSNPQFNSEGKLVYAARREKGDVAVFVGDEAGPGFDEILSAVVFLSDSGHFAYVGKQGNDFVTVVDNHPGSVFVPSKHSPSQVPWILLSLDGKHLAFETVSGGAAFKEGKTLRALRSVVLDGKEGAEYDAFGLVAFGADKDWRHYSYLVVGAKGNDSLVDVDGHDSRLYNFAGDLRLSDDSKNVLFTARDGGRFLRVTYELEPGGSKPIASAMTSK